jgi:hypothetical protein
MLDAVAILSACRQRKCNRAVLGNLPSCPLSQCRSALLSRYDVTILQTNEWMWLLFSVTMVERSFDSACRPSFAYRSQRRHYFSMIPSVMWSHIRCSFLLDQIVHLSSYDISVVFEYFFLSLAFHCPKSVPIF